jgi:hypothetical protein
MNHESIDDKWATMLGGYRVPYDPRPAVQRLSENVDVEATWAELWNELHHQGDLGEASYAAVTLLTEIHASGRRPDWNLFSLAALIEVERHRRGNPPIPEWLEFDYRRAWKQLFDLALTSLRDEADADAVQSALAIVAIYKNALKLGALINWLDWSELDEIVNDKLSWQELFSDER